MESDVPNFTSLKELNDYLTYNGCKRCELGLQKGVNGCCISRGPMDSRLMIVGESPGRDEDREGSPFIGKAGQLLDKIWKCAGMDTNSWYCTNTILHRSIAPPGSGRQNLPPTTNQKKACSPYLWQQIRLLNPNIIVTLGTHATAALMNKTSCRLGDYRGKLINSGRFLVYPMWHPSSILQTSRDLERQKVIKQQIWTDVKNLRVQLKEMNLI